MVHSYGVSVAMNEQEGLKDFFAAYFHEDWREEAKDAAGVLALYLAQNIDEDARRSLAHSIEAFAARHGSDAALEQALFSELGCYYMPSAEHRSAREWLAEIVTRLTR